MQGTLNGNADAMIFLLSANGSSLVQSTYLGGSNSDILRGVTLRPDGNICVTGRTNSSNFPITSNTYQSNFAGGANDIVLTVLNSTLSSILFSTFIGGSGDDQGEKIKATNCSAYIVGHSSSVDFDITNGAFQTTLDGTVDAVVLNVPFVITSISVSDDTLCAGQNVSFSALPNGMSSYSWSGPNGFASSQQNFSINNVTTNDSGYFILSITDSSGCIYKDSVKIIVYPLPTITATSNSPLCEGDTLNLTCMPGGMSSYAWSGPGGFLSTQQNPSITNITLSAAGTYTVMVTDTNGCSDMASVNVTIHPLPSVTAASNSPLCEGDTLNLSCMPGGMSSYAWSGPGGFLSTQQNPSITNVTLSAAGTYTVTVTDANGCSDTASVNVTIHPLPSVTATSNSPLCEGDTLKLFSAGGMSTYVWMGPNGYTSNVQNPVIPGATVGMSGTYMITVTDGNGCVGEDSVEVTVNPKPVITLASNSPVCEGKTLQLSAGGGTAYSWTGPNGFSSTQQNPVIDNVGQGAAGTYYAMVSNGGCTAMDSIEVTINPSPEITLKYSNDTCDKGKGRIQALVSGGTEPYQYQWNTGSVGSEIGNLHGGYYYVVVTDANGCSRMDSVTIVNWSEDCPYFVYVPGAFSPNGDGRNDVLHVKGEGVVWIQFEIYNRWGNKVFESNDLSMGWDGTYKGQMQNTGVFVYILEAEFENGERIKKSGDITLLR